MDSNFTSRPQKLGAEETDDQHLAFLVLHNDDTNSFDYVMETLVEICDHSLTQAEQCATITHYKGKCDVKTGEFEELSFMKGKLVSKGLSVTID